MTAARITGYLALALLGVLVGAAGGLVQGAWTPGGLLLALAGSGALFLGGAKATGRRAGAGVPAAFWLITVIYLSGSRPEGDFLFVNGLGPYVYLLGGTMLGVAATTLAAPPPPAAAPPSHPAPRRR
jgi:hypothetical protein